MYKLTVYEKGENFLAPVHKYIEEEKPQLIEAAQEHMSNNPKYVTILIAYKPQEVEVF